MTSFGQRLFRLIGKDDRKSRKQKKRESRNNDKLKQSGLNFSDEFAGEIEAVCEGVQAYKHKVQQPEQSSALLRRNVHRLEKALCFPVSKSVFAEQYIVETLDVLARLLTSRIFDLDEVVWALDVLDRYFDAVDKTSPKIQKAHEIYSRILGEWDFREKNRFPKEFKDVVSLSGINPPAFFDLCKGRVSCRWFLPDIVESAKIEFAIRCASEAASACNRQPYRFLWIKNVELKRQIVNLPFGTQGFGEQLPNLLMLVGDLSNFAMPRDRHLIYIDSCLAVSQFMLAMTSMGLATVSMNWPDVIENNASARELLGLEAYDVPILLLGVGYPDPTAKIPFSQKKKVEGLLTVYD